MCNVICQQYEKFIAGFNRKANAQTIKLYISISTTTISVITVNTVILDVNLTNKVLPRKDVQCYK